MCNLAPDEMCQGGIAKLLTTSDLVMGILMNIPTDLPRLKGFRYPRANPPKRQGCKAVFHKTGCTVWRTKGHDHPLS